MLRKYHPLATTSTTTGANRMIQLQRIGAHDLPLPKQATEGAAGFDLQSAEDVVLYPCRRIAITTGFAWAIPPGQVGMIRPRSGLAVRNGIDVLAGTVDSDFRGQVAVVLINHGGLTIDIKAGDRIAQMVVQPCMVGATVECDELPSTERGNGGFGSTGA
jgi:dUTP pyrophosphatase